MISEGVFVVWTRNPNLGSGFFFLLFLLGNGMDLTDKPTRLYKVWKGSNVSFSVSLSQFVVFLFFTS